jgi:hypothetical protein
MDTSLSILVIVLALVAHLVAIYLGFQFHLWMLEKSAEQEDTTNNGWWKKQTDNCNDNTENSGDVPNNNNLSNRQIAFLQTLAVWLLMIALVARWRVELLLIVLAGLVLVLQKYPPGRVPESQLYLALFGYMAWLAVLATTAALFLWPLHQFHYNGGTGSVLFYRALSIGGAISFSMVAALALIAFCLQQKQVADDTGKCMESAFAALA